MGAGTLKNHYVPAYPFLVLGLLMPIDFVQGVPPVIFDVLRYGLAVWITLLLFSRNVRPRRAPLLGAVASLLLISGVLSIVKNVVYGGSLFGPAVTFISVLAAYAVVRVRVHHRWVLLGFVFGCTLSSLDIIMQALGLPFMGMPSTYGFRYSGFSYASTAVAPLLAVAICVVLVPWAWKRRKIVLRLLLLSLLSIGVYLSQGRGGLLALFIALMILIFAYSMRRPLLVLFCVLIGFVAFVLSGIFPTVVDYFARTDAVGTSDITSGRFHLNAAAWDAFWKSGLLGINPSEAHLYNPHMAPLSAALNIGPLGFLATSIICILLAVIAFSPSSRLPVLFKMIASITLIVALLEPTGFFVGFSGVTLMMITFAQYGQLPSESTSRLQVTRA